MKIYRQWDQHTLWHGYCHNTMSEMADDSNDLIVTDPPYGIGFMGKDWDKALPPVDDWRECFRVLKPGSFMFVMCIPRMDCQARMVMNLSAAGFDVSFTPIYWTFATGFPKAMNVSKKLDERLGMEREVIEERYKGKHEGGSSYQWSQMDNESGYAPITLPVSPEAQSLDGAYSGFQPKPAVEVILVCQKPFTVRHRRSDVYRILEGKYDYWYTQRKSVIEPKEGRQGNIDKLSEKWAKELEQVGYSLKDGDVIERRLALREGLQDEVIVNRSQVLWSRPYKDTDITSSVTHALDTGRGVTWLEDCKIPANGEKTGGDGYWGMSQAKGWNANNVPYKRDDMVQRTNNGRFPANLLVSDDVLNDGVERQSGGRSGLIKSQWLAQCRAGEEVPILNPSAASSGSFSRYFSLDKWAQEHLPDSVLRTFPFLIVPKPSKREKNAGLDGLEDKQMYNCDGSWGSLEIFGTTDGGRKPRKNNHPTCKPVTLMSYLIEMGSRPGDVVYDPYMGSGSTGVACVHTGRSFRGSDIDEEYCEISALRMMHAMGEMTDEEAVSKLTRAMVGAFIETQEQLELSYNE